MFLCFSMGSAVLNALFVLVSLLLRVKCTMMMHEVYHRSIARLYIG